MPFAVRLWRRWQSRRPAVLCIPIITMTGMPASQPWAWCFRGDAVIRLTTRQCYVDLESAGETIDVAMCDVGDSQDLTNQPDAAWSAAIESVAQVDLTIPPNVMMMANRHRDHEEAPALRALSDVRKPATARKISTLLTQDTAKFLVTRRMLEERCLERKPGLSVVMVTTHYEPYLEASIRCLVGYVDEIVVVHNDCHDNTADQLDRLATETKGVVRPYHFTPDVIPGRAVQPSGLGGEVHTYTNYRNWSLLKARYDCVFLNDADVVTSPALAKQLAQSLRNMREKTVYTTRAFDLSYPHPVTPDGHLGDRELRLTDIDFIGPEVRAFRISPDIAFTTEGTMDMLCAPAGATTKIIIPARWHLRFCKQELGFGRLIDTEYQQRHDALDAICERVDTQVQMSSISPEDCLAVREQQVDWAGFRPLVNAWHQATSEDQCKASVAYMEVGIVEALRSLDPTLKPFLPTLNRQEDDALVLATIGRPLFDIPEALVQEIVDHWAHPRSSASHRADWRTDLPQPVGDE